LTAGETKVGSSARSTLRRTAIAYSCSTIEVAICWDASTARGIENSVIVDEATGEALFELVAGEAVIGARLAFDSIGVGELSFRAT
jgi:hypothetical protein